MLHITHPLARARSHLLFAAFANPSSINLNARCATSVKIISSVRSEPASKQSTFPRRAFSHTARGLDSIMCLYFIMAHKLSAA